MLGAIIGDIIGSPYEFKPHKSVEFPLITDKSYFTDDSVMTCALAQALMNVMPKRGSIPSVKVFQAEAVKCMRTFGLKYPNAGYGIRFMDWIDSENPKPYNSFGNGSAMRVAPVAWAFDYIEDVERFAEASATVSHDNPEGIRGAKATAAAIFLARSGKEKFAIKEYVSQKYYYDLTRSLDDIRPYYDFDETCQGSVPEAITAYLEASDFESAVRNAVSLGGDADTQADIAGAIAEGSWGIPRILSEVCLQLLDPFLLNIVKKWHKWLNS